MGIRALLKGTSVAVMTEEVIHRRKNANLLSFYEQGWLQSARLYFVSVLFSPTYAQGRPLLAHLCHNHPHSHTSRCRYALASSHTLLSASILGKKKKPLQQLLRRLKHGLYQYPHQLLGAADNLLN